MADKPSRPVLVYDGDCAFCALWIERWQIQTGDAVDYRPHQTAASDYPDIPRAAFEKGVHLILPGGSVFTNAEAVFRLLADYGGQRLGAWLYDQLPGFAAASEAAYRWVERHRSLCNRIVRFLFGASLAPASYRLSRWLFIRALGLVYFFAFFSISGQIIGLVGEHGILPAGEFLRLARGSLGESAYQTLPTLFWLNSSDAALSAATVIGTILSLAVVVGFAQQIALAVLFILYLSLVFVGQDFLSFQWDVLLLEAGILAIFFAPSHLLPCLPRDETEPPHAMLWLVRWLLFRVMFASGFVKWVSGDPTWHNLTAMSYHYYTQPLPTPLAWLADKLPLPFDQFSTLMTFVIELGMPLLIIFPRRIRYFGAGGLLFLQLLILVTGNYTFFNLLCLALMVSLFDDASLRRVIPERWREQMTGSWRKHSPPYWRRIAIGMVATAIWIGSGATFSRQILGRAVPIPAPARDLARWLSRYGIVNTYGLFAVMTTSRPEIIIEGSNDGEHWLAYEFQFKPGDLRRAPPLIAPLQPRLDWQMWFAALGSYRSSPWFFYLMLRLAQGEPSVLALLGHNPFPDAPPLYLRAVLYEYHFSDFETLRRDGAWWERQEIGEYFPVISIRQP